MGMNLHNEMAKEAYDLVSSINENRREFRSLARSFPSMIQVNGLGCAISYLYSKNNKPPFKILYDEIDNWTKKKMVECPANNLDNRTDGSKKNTASRIAPKIESNTGNKAECANKQDLACRITGLNSMEYRLYTNEIMNLCLWIKRFAEGMLSE